MKRFQVYAMAAVVGLSGIRVFGGTDGTWNKAGTGSAPTYLWSDTANWVGTTIADGQNGTANFDAVDVTNEYVSLGSGSRTIGHLSFNDTVPNSSNWWSLASGTLNLSVSSGTSTIQVSNVSAYMEPTLTLTGGFAKTGVGNLTLKNFPTASINIAQGRVTYFWNADGTLFTTQSLSGGGDVAFTGQSTGYYSFRAAPTYTGTLSYTGHTIVNLTPGSGNWWQGTLWLEKDDVLSHASVVDLLSGKIYTRNQTANGLTVAGLTGNAGTFITTDQVVQKWIVNTAAGTSYDFAGKIGADGTGTGNNNVSLTKNGLGTQILSGANTFVGPLAVNGGTLLVNNTTGSGTGTTNSVTVASGASLGGTGTVLSASTTLSAGSFLVPGGTNAVGTLTVSNLVLTSGMTYQWECNTVTSDLTRVLGTISLPASATVALGVVGGASMPTQGVLFTYGVTNAGASDLSDWAVSSPATGGSFTDDVANKRVLFTATYATGRDGVWNKGGAVSPPTNAWANAANWTNGIVADGQDFAAHFDAVDEVSQYIDLVAGSRTIGHLSFNDTVPTSSNWWSLANGTLNLRVSTGSSTVQVSNVSVYMEPTLTLTGDFTKTGAGTLTLKNFPSTSINIAQGRVTYNDNRTLNFLTQNISGSGEIEFTGQSLGYFGFNGYPWEKSLTYTGHTIVNLNAGTWPSGVLFLDRDDVLPHATVLDVLAGKIYMRSQTINGLTVAGLTGNAGALITTDFGGIHKLTLNVTNGANYAYAGMIGADSAYYANTSTKVISLIKQGLGTQILTGANTFSGTLAVNGGTLLVNNAAGSGTGIGNSVTVASGASLGGTGLVLSASTTLNAGSILIPGGTNAVGTLTVSNLVMASGMTYPWECGLATSDLVRVLGTVSLPSLATITLSAVEGASLPAQGVLLTYGVTNSGATDLGGWAVSGMGPGTNITFTDDAANRRVLYTVTAAANDDADGVWNKAGSVSVPDYPWYNAGNWVSGIVAGGTNRTAHFDQVDSAMQWVNLGGGSRTIGYLSFNDTVPAAYGYWELHNGTLNLRVTSGSPTITVSNTNVDMGVAADLTLNGNFTKMGAGSLWLKNFPNNSINIAEGRVVIYRNAFTYFTTLSVSGGGDVEFNGQPLGFFSFQQGGVYTGTLSYTGHTRVNLSAGASWEKGVLWLEKEDVLPHATVVDVLAGKVFTRNQQTIGLTVAGLTGNAGTLITTDFPFSALQKWTLDVTNGVSCDYAGKIGADVAVTYSSNNIALTKIGNGTQILSGANTFAGTLAVSNGTLLVNNTTGSGSGISNSVTVATGATLGGTGTLLSTNVAFDAAATLAPGGTNSVGTLTFGGNLNLAAGAICDIDCTNSVSDTVAVGGTLTLPSTATVNLSVADASLPRRITLFTAGTLAGETDLRGWQAHAGVRRYLISREGTTVVATLLPVGTLIRLF